MKIKNMRILKKVSTLTILTLVFLVIFQAPFASMNYPDVSGNHWAISHIQTMYDEGIMGGYPDGTFGPERSVTYAEFITMITTFADGKKTGSTGGHWASGYYERAAEMGILHRNDIPTSFLDRAIPRADMAYLVSRTLDIEMTQSEKNSYRDNIGDIAVAGNRQDEVILAYGSGIISGYPDGTFGPARNLTRAESAAVMTKMLEFDVSSPDPVEEPEEEPEEEPVDPNDYDLSGDLPMVPGTSIIDYGYWVSETVPLLESGFEMTTGMASEHANFDLEELKLGVADGEFPFKVGMRGEISTGSLFFEIQGEHNVVRLVKDGKQVGAATPTGATGSGKTMYFFRDDAADNLFESQYLSWQAVNERAIYLFENPFYQNPF